MTHLGKPSPVKWISRFCSEEHLRSLKSTTCNSSNAIFHSKVSYFHSSGVPFTKEAIFIKWKWVSQFSLRNHLGHGGVLTLKAPANISFLSGSRGFCCDKSTSTNPHASYRNPRAVAEAQAALMDYLHGTRGLHFTDAEHMSKNSPIFLDKLLNKVEKEEQIGWALRRFFRYHPINEFEPFFESAGLQPSEFNSLLPRDLMFLSDNEELLENYHVLCNYGVARGKIGRMYKEATKIFRYKLGVLDLKLQGYEGLCLSKSSVIKIVASSPYLLIGDVNKEFVKVLDVLGDIGIERDWIVGTLSEDHLYDWSRMLMVLQFFIETGFTKQDLGTLIRRHPDFLVDGSGRTVFSMVVLLLKFGGTRMEMFSLLSQFPHVEVVSFVRNLWRGLLFLIEIEMDSEDIQKLLRTHTELFGLCSLKKPNSILTYLNVGKKRLCRIIKEDPNQLKKYALGVKVSPLPNSGQDERSLMEKRKFLLRLGFIENSKEMKKALTVFRGKGDELQDRYDFLVKTGLDPNDVSNMIKLAPHILNQKIDVLESKINFLVNNMGYPLSSLVAFPAYMSYTVGRVKLRFLMYDWLKDRGKARPALALSSVLACSDKVFRERFISHHPKGPEVWENFKKALSSG